MMGALSMGLPMIFMPAGPMLRGNWHGQTLGSGTDAWKYWAELRAGTITQEDWAGVESGIARSQGTCMTMGTAATMTSAVEALGFTLPGASSIPAADSRHAAMATATGHHRRHGLEESGAAQIAAAASTTPSRRCCPCRLDERRHSPARNGPQGGHPLKIDRCDELARRTLLANMRPPAIPWRTLLRGRPAGADAGARRPAYSARAVSGRRWVRTRRRGMRNRGHPHPRQPS
jgi:dihydroxy-acid dehydratase